MDDREFFDYLYQMWTKTTGAKETYWDYQKTPYVYEHVMSAVGKDDQRDYVGSFATEEDADFITAVHGCFGDLYRKLHEALDEADRADYQHDERECRIAELELELMELKERVDK